MTFPAVVEFAPLLEPESAIAKPPIATAIAAVPAAMEAVSLRLLKILCLRAMVVDSLRCELLVDPTMGRVPGNSMWGTQEEPVNAAAHNSRHSSEKKAGHCFHA